MFPTAGAQILPFLCQRDMVSGPFLQGRTMLRSGFFQLHGLQGSFFVSSRQGRSLWFLAAVVCGLTHTGFAEDSFETFPAGDFQQLKGPLGQWQAESGHAAVHQGRARTGSRSLRILGGTQHSVELILEQPLSAASRLQFWAERWTRRQPFSCEIAAADHTGAFREVGRGDHIIIGDYHTKIDLPLTKGVSRIRITVTSPDGGGLLLDDVTVEAERPMVVAGVEVVQPVMPVLTRKPVNPVIGFNVKTTGNLEPLALESVVLSLQGTTRIEDIVEVEVWRGGSQPTDALSERLGAVAGTISVDRLVVSGRVTLNAGDNWFWVTARLADDADIDGRVDARLFEVTAAGKQVAVPDGNPSGNQRMGVAVRLVNDDNVKIYRIPGLVRTNAGSLIAVYDIRHRGGADLPADIDVGVSRSVDGGKTWEPMRVAIDMGREARFNYDGVGDPSVLVDRKTGRIFVAALWSHGNRGWNGSGPGMTPDATGQLVMVVSDDDGKTWSAARNVTSLVKDPAWRLFFNGPGRGIAMANGTLVFPAQFRDAKGMPYSTLMWSADHGRNWTCGTGVKSNTTEAQVVQLGDGSIMINCRDNRGGSRTIATTSDLGQTWALHPTDRRALPESVCMASLLRWDVPHFGPRLFFSNPATTRGRHSMTLKISADEGNTWPEADHLLYDSRNGLGYSCLAPADDDHVGVLYEGRGELYFLRFPTQELLSPQR